MLPDDLESAGGQFLENISKMKSIRRSQIALSPTGENDRYSPLRVGKNQNLSQLALEFICLNPAIRYIGLAGPLIALSILDKTYGLGIMRNPARILASCTAPNFMHRTPAHAGFAEAIELTEWTEKPTISGKHLSALQ